MPSMIIAQDTWDNYTVDFITGNPGNGSEASPYEISSAGHLAYLSEQTNAGSSYLNTWFKLTSDIDLSVHDWIPIKNFSGKFLGNGKLIHNLYVGRNGTLQSNSGLFAGLSSGAYLEGIHVTGGHVYGNNTAGGIVGAISLSSGDVKIIGCSNNAHVTIARTGGWLHAGGIIGEAVISGDAVILIDNCANYGFILIDGKNESTYVSSGGILGFGQAISSGETNIATITIQNSYSNADIYSTDASGGIAGWLKIENNGTGQFYPEFYIEGSYSYGKIYGSRSAGGITGWLEKNSEGTIEIRNSIVITDLIDGANSHRIYGKKGRSSIDPVLYNNYAKAGITAGGDIPVSSDENGIEGKDIAVTDLYSKQLYQGVLGWDFTSIWAIPENINLPYFQWQSIPVGIEKINTLNVQFNLANISDSIQIRNDQNMRIGVINTPSSGISVDIGFLGISSGDIISFVNYESGRSMSYPVQVNVVATGKISVTLDVPDNNALVTIYHIDPDKKEIIPVDTARYDGGKYYSDNLSLGEYLVSVENINGYLPTYYTNALIWNEADIVQVSQDGSTVEINIKLNKIPEIESGDITIDGNVYDASSIKARVAMNSTVGIYRSTKSAQKSEDWELVRKVRPDANGYYRFDNLPAGVYKVVIDLPGYTLQGNGIEIDAKSGNVYTANDFMVDEVNKTINDVTTSVPDYGSVQLNIYPNPFDGEIRISGLDGPYVVRIYDLLGRESIQRKGSSGEAEIDLGRLPSGIYIVRLEVGGTTISRKVMKN